MSPQLDMKCANRSKVKVRFTVINNVVQVHSEMNRRSSVITVHTQEHRDVT